MNPPTENSLPHIVVVGAGFGGLTFCQKFPEKLARITLIDVQNHHLFQPLLYQVASAGLSAIDIAQPIRAIFGARPNFDVIMAEVTGFDLAGKPGSAAHDEIFYSDERGFYRETNHAGGLEGGMTTGDPLVARAAMKPLPTLTKPLRSVDIETKEPAAALRERTDSCTVPAAGVVGEAMIAFVLADAYREKFGGDHIDDVAGAVDAYRERIGWRADH